MQEPLVVTISHRLGRAEAKRRLDAGLDHIRREAAPFVQGMELAWHADRLDFDVTALRQRVTGGIEVEDDLVRVEIRLPWLLRLAATALVGRIRREGNFLLEKPPEAEKPPP
jgi:Putative polyhydroxyalkanoic acid system protein (PHA_gran_rgn)